MDFEEFLHVIEDRLPDYLIQYDIEDIHTDIVNKNNGKKYTGIAVTLKGERLSPNIYMDYYYSMYSGGTSLERILELISDEYKRAREKLKGFKDIEDLDSTENIFLKIVNRDRNSEMLAECPYIEYQDLAITFRILVKHDDEGIASAVLKYREFNRLNMDIDKLYEIAKENTKRLMPPVLRRIADILYDKFPDADIPSEQVDLYILTNSIGVNGAVYMIYDDILRDFAKEHGSFYILPSSIHELLLFPCDREEEREGLIEMVKEVNEYIVDDTEYLSDTVYFYNADKGQIVA